MLAIFRAYTSVAAFLQASPACLLVRHEIFAVQIPLDLQERLTARRINEHKRHYVETRVPFAQIRN